MHDKFIRNLEFGRKVENIDVEARTVTLSFSSAEPVKRYFGMEVLSHRKESVDLTRLNDGGAVLEDHGGKQIGVVEKAWIEGDRGMATLRFSKSAAADVVFQDVVDGIRRNVSVSYQVLERKLTEMKDDEKGESETFEITRWMPYEISIVSVPADPTVGVGRALEFDNAPEQIPNADDLKPASGKYEPQKRSADPVVPAPQKKVKEVRIMDKTPEEIREEELIAERSRAKEIIALGRSFQMEKEANEAVIDGMPLDMFRQSILVRQQEKDKEFENRGKDIGLTDQEVKEYSFTRALCTLAFPNDAAVQKAGAFEIEASRAYAAQIGTDPKGIFVPPEVAMNQRTFDMTTGGGSNLRATDHRADLFIDILRNKMVTGRAGVFILDGLVGNLTIPRQTGAMTSYWIDTEAAGITAASNPTVDQVAMSPKTVGAYGDISRKLLKQGTPSAEQLVRSDIAAVLALAIDLAVLKGTAANGQPRGITQTSGIGSANWAADNTPTWAEVVAMETAIDTANALDGELKYVMGSAMRGAMKTIVKASGQLGFLMSESGTLNGYGVIGSNQMGAGEVIFGRFADVILGMWGGMDLQVNPYIEALEKAGAIRITALQDVDVAVRRPASFVFNDNTGGS